MIEELATMILWGFITIFLLISGEVAIEYAYILKTPTVACAGSVG